MNHHPLHLTRDVYAKASQQKRNVSAGVAIRVALG